jgi:hypothetical protein
MDSTPQDGRVQLPGFGLPLERSSEIPTATVGWLANPISVRERTMIALMATLKDKSDWHRKAFDEEIVGKWRSEEDGQTDNDDSGRRNGRVSSLTEVTGRNWSRREYSTT